MTRVVEVARNRVAPNENPTFRDYILALRALGLHETEFELLYVVMPRYGNLLSGLECDAPGGTANPGETREQVADREFSEESDLITLCVYDPFPSWMQFASGCYDEVQHIDFALVIGDPTKLVEGATEWGGVPLSQVSDWACLQNDPLDSFGWGTGRFVPVDGKVVLATMWLAHEIALLMLPL